MFYRKFVFMDVETKNNMDENVILQSFHLNKFNLSFIDDNKEFEKHFIVYYLNKSLNQIRLALFSALIIYSLFGILDAAFIPDYHTKFWTLRSVVVISSLLFFLLLSFSKFFKKMMLLISMILVISTSAGILSMLFWTPVDLYNYYFLGLILVLLMNYGFMRQRFILAGISGILIVSAYIILAFVLDKTPFLQNIINSFFLVSINLIGMFIAYIFELNARKEFYYNQILNIEKLKLKNQGARMEAKIKHKAAQIQNINKGILNEIGKMSSNKPS